jgi:uncharacterized protein (TIGR02246 family)
VKWHISILIVVLSLFAATIVFADSSDSDLQSAANAMVNRFADSWNRADGVVYGVNYWPEAERVNPAGAIRSGRAAIVKEHVDLWAGPFKGSRVSGKVRRIQKLGSNYMVVDFDIEVTGVLQVPPGSPPSAHGILRNHLKHIMEKRNGVWKVLSGQNTFIAPN